MAERVCPRCDSVLPAGAFGGLCPRCLFLDESDELPPGTVLAGHEILGTLGRGGMGVVYRARHQRLGREVALKVLPSGRPDAAARFAREARALARLDHENVVRVHDFGEEQGEFYIAMELVEGHTLRDEIARGPLPVERARAVARAVCRALAAAHRHGVVHRDVKPENVLLGADGAVKVADFGITRLLGDDADDARLTRTGALVGTPHYVAPERLTDPASADHRVDLYAAGVLLYEMLTGHVPSGAAGLPGTALDGVLRKALQPGPAQRYASAEEMERDLAEGRGGLDFAEVLWQGGVAVLIAAAAATTALTAVRCLTPRVEAARPASPLEYAEPLPDGRWVSWARFELAWVVVSAALGGAALAAYAALVRHWTRAGLLLPSRPGLVRGGWLVLGLGGVTVAVWAVRRLTGLEVMQRYAPLYGGVLILVVLLTAALVQMHARRTGRRPLRQWPVWLGLALGLLPPAVETVQQVLAWEAAAAP